MRPILRFRFGLPLALLLLLLVATACSWSQYRGGPTHAGNQPFETAITRANVTSLTTLWTASTGAGIYSSPTIANGLVYVGSNNGVLSAFDASGATGCSGIPNVCAPLWTAAVPGGPVSSAAAVADGVVFVGSGDGHLVAFDAAGTRGCAGVPKVCAPLWSAAAGDDRASSPTVDGGLVFTGGADTLYAFDATGTVGCAGTPRTCTPIWTAPVNCSILCSPAVARGVVYANSNFPAELFAFDARGVTGCSGTPRTCTPLWSAPTGSGTASHWPVAVADDTVFVSGGSALLAFDATGTAGCSGVPKTCVPRWTSTILSGITSPPAVGRGAAIVAADGHLYAFDAAGASGCSGTPKTCAPEWSAEHTGLTAPTIANDVVFSAGFGQVNAFDAAGVFGCSGRPKVCPPGWFSPTIEPNSAGVAVANGTVVVATGDGKVYAFRG